MVATRVCFTYLYSFKGERGADSWPVRDALMYGLKEFTLGA